jgi:integrase
VQTGERSPYGARPAASWPCRRPPILWLCERADAGLKPATLGLEKLRRVVEALGTRPIDVRHRALLLVGFAGALRRSELVGLDQCNLPVDLLGSAWESIRELA